jgi:hypothetical protein
MADGSSTSKIEPATSLGTSMAKEVRKLTNDPRVPKEEAEQVVGLLKKDGTTVDVHITQTKATALRNAKTRSTPSTAGVDWFNKYLKGQEPAQ